eukprot:1715843-Pyramimonas_sp.AAC.1
MTACARVACAWRTRRARGRRGSAWGAVSGRARLPSTLPSTTRQSSRRGAAWTAPRGESVTSAMFASTSRLLRRINGRRQGTPDARGDVR